MQSDGKIDAAGQSGNASGAHSLAIARYNADGSLDTSFNSTGTEVVGPVAATDAMRGIGVMPDGNILATATSPANSGDIALVKLLPSGALDSSFGSGGVVTTNVAQDEANALAIDPTNGRVVVAGTARTDASHASFLVARYTVTDPPVPVVSSISPDSGRAAGGTHVAVLGSGFTGASAVMFGATPATSFTVTSDRKITAVSPARPPANVDVRVTTPGGTSPQTAADVFALPQPAVTSINPTSGPAAGGTSVTLVGSAFTGASQVVFGSTPATSYVVNSDTKITAVSPARPPVNVHVRVTTPGGTSAPTAADIFKLPTPAVTSISPTRGPPAGGTSVTVSGSGFTGASGVRFGSTAAASFTINSDGTITAVSPPLPVSTVHVHVTTPGGTSASSSADVFTVRET